MVTLVPGRPVDRATPVLRIDAGLQPGLHRFRLVAVDSSGRHSQPDEVWVRIEPRSGPVIPVVPMVPASSPPYPAPGR